MYGPVLIILIAILLNEGNIRGSPPALQPDSKELTVGLPVLVIGEVAEKESSEVEAGESVSKRLIVATKILSLPPGKNLGEQWLLETEELACRVYPQMAQQFAAGNLK